MTPSQRFAVTLFLGVFGVHRLVDRKFGTGLLWLVTGGLLWVGWASDLCLAAKALAEDRRTRLHSPTRNPFDSSR